MTQTMRERLINAVGGVFVLAGAVFGGYLGRNLYAPLFAQLGAIGAGFLLVGLSAMIDAVRASESAQITVESTLCRE